MIIEVSRILLGVALVCFHRPIAAFMHAREQELTGFLRQRGVNVPAFRNVDTITDAYFCLGVAAFLLAVGSLWIPF
jgi:hypothetical protein